ncbi:MAG: helix-turn-helix domain-containing protein [Spirochaetaceae bacterium]|nr:MAG: helix-turn-helix domain-containing protein [Spirochaetaceae bacterium]
MNDVHVTVDPMDLSSFPEGRVNSDRIDATTDQDIQEHIEQDTNEAMVDMGVYIRSVRARVGMTQREFSDRIGISVDTLRNWEQGRRYPTGTARALLRIIDKAPEVAVNALQRY